MPNWLVLIILGLVLYGVSLAPPVPVTWRPFLQWCGGLLAFIGLLLLVLLVLHVPLPGAAAGPRSLAAGALLFGTLQTDPATSSKVSEPPNSVPNVSNASASSTYVLRYVLNAGLVLLTILSAAGSVATQMGITAAWLGLTDVQWHWALAAFSLATALNAGLAHTPPILNPPTQSRLAVESVVDSLRKTV